MRYGNERGSYTISDLPGSPQVAVSTHAFVYPERRGNGEGQALHKERLETIANLGYDYVLCTVNVTNAAQVHILEKNGWTRLADFRSSYTEHRVAIYGKKLREETTGEVPA